MVSEEDYVYLNELSFAVYNIETGEVKTFDSDSDRRAFYEPLPEGGAEDAVSILYEDTLEWEALNINHKRLPNALKYALGFDEHYEFPSNAPDIPQSLVASIRSSIEQNVSDDSTESGLDIIEIDGIPDLLVYSKDTPSKFEFVEVKAPPEDLQDSQRKWLDRFDFLPRKIACMFTDEGSRQRFIENESFERLLEKPVDEKNQRTEMDSMEIASILKDVEVGDQLLFNDRKQPLTVVNENATAETFSHEVTGVKVSSRRGKNMVLSRDGEWFVGSMYRRSLWWVDVLDEDLC
jgi:hypothetical protein